MRKSLSYCTVLFPLTKLSVFFVPLDSYHPKDSQLDLFPPHFFHTLGADKFFCGEGARQGKEILYRREWLEVPPSLRCLGRALMDG